ncbi:MAG: AAA family ATPase, partial [Pseudomonadota bacterium]|nr:AAA family ATPase [Pseudomonadota bacterium]
MTSKNPILKQMTRKQPDSRTASQPSFELWVCMVEEKTAKATLVCGPSNLNTSALIEPGWYFFQPQKIKGTTLLSVQSALYMTTPPTKGIQSYLETKAFRGIGRETAKKLSIPLTNNIFEDLSLPYKEISNKHGISEAIAKTFEKAWAKTKETHALEIMLRQFGITDKTVNQIIELFGNSIIPQILLNPFELVRKVPNFNFEDAENIINSLSLDLSSDQRIISAMESCLFRFEASKGHTCVPIESAFKGNQFLIDGDYEVIEGCLRSATGYFKFKEIENQEYISTLTSFERENHIASCINMFLSRHVPLNKWTDFDVSTLTLKDSFELSRDQIEALNGALNSKIFLITGGPGTGKTRMVEAIVKALKNLGKHVTLCAPTGRAARRLGEEGGLATFNPMTIHLFLTYIKSMKIKEVGTLIIDEASMVDTELMAEILNSLTSKDSLIMIGDADQLPPVGPGQVFKDLLDSDKLPYARLTDNFRQSEGSGIVKLAADVIRGNNPRLDLETAQAGAEFIYESNENKIQSRILDLYNSILPEQLDLLTSEEIQILTPMRKGAVGTIALNSAIQQTLWSEATPILTKNNSKILYHGDRVIQTSNNYEL